MIRKLEYFPNKYNRCKNVCWEDVIVKIEDEFTKKSHKFLPIEDLPPTFVLHNNFLPNTIQIAYDEVRECDEINEMHIYTSLGKGSPTFGNHKDDDDVLLVQSVGKMVYNIEGKLFMLNPGDGLIIPAGVYHNPIVVEPRITLSFSW